jgi:hypothetical protein
MNELGLPVLGHANIYSPAAATNPPPTSSIYSSEVDGQAAQTASKLNAVENDSVVEIHELLLYANGKSTIQA